jgi:hypothetical protein
MAAAELCIYARIRTPLPLKLLHGVPISLSLDVFDLTRGIHAVFFDASSLGSLRQLTLDD